LLRHTSSPTGSGTESPATAARRSPSRRPRPSTLRGS